ncbi:MAG: hypothetical protein AAFX94_08250, partial [Myxococcota bacterium]
MAGTLISIGFPGLAHAVPTPSLLRTPFLQGPVEAGPGDTMILFGADILPGAEVVYEAFAGTPPAPPTSIVSPSTAAQGRLLITSGPNGSYVDAPNSITVTLPAVMDPKTSYALWARNPEGEFSEPAVINDPRPRWISPGTAYESAQTGSAPRQLRIVGRNLDSFKASQPLIRLTSALGTHYLAATPDPNSPSQAIIAPLPPTLAVTSYWADVQFDGVWYPVRHGRLEVRPDPAPLPQVQVQSPCGAVDDTPCVLAAIATAQTLAGANGAAEVVFGPGAWHLRSKAGLSSPLVVPDYGIVVPERVHLRGLSGARIVMHASWEDEAAFTLQGQQTVTQLRFEGLDADEATPTFNQDRCEVSAPESRTFFWLGAKPWDPNLAYPEVVADVRFEDNEFIGVYTATSTYGRPIRSLVIRQNYFRTDFTAVSLMGNTTLPYVPYAATDSVIEDNLFEPGYYFDYDPFTDPADDPSVRERNRGSLGEGPQAMYIAGSDRLLVHRNTINGRVGSGFRAGIFFGAHGDNDMVLISGNELSCTGRLTGDGEAIALEANGSISAFSDILPVYSVKRGAVWVKGDLVRQEAGAYTGSWVVAVSGPGAGQARKIQEHDYSKGVASFLVEGDWDVPLVPGQTLVVVHRAFHDTVIAGNVVDNTSCNSATSWGHEGVIGWFGSVLDSVIEGNEQYDTGGVFVLTGTQFGDQARREPGASQTTFEPFTLTMFVYGGDIKNNRVQGLPSFGAHPSRDLCEPITRPA